MAVHGGAGVGIDDADVLKIPIVLMMLMLLMMLDRSTVMAQLKVEEYMKQLHALAESFNLPVIALKSGIQ